MRVNQTNAFTYIYRRLEKTHSGAIGAAAFTRTVVDPDYDDGSEPVTLAIFGKVPPGLADQLPF